MTLAINQFSEFYTEMYRLKYPTQTRTPHPWQIRLAERVCARSDWPAGICTPTGSGKSVVSLVHVFACALSKSHLPRLVYVVPRRILADQVYGEASELLNLLADESQATAPVLRAVREALLDRQPTNMDGTRDGQVPVITSMTRGGIFGRTDTSWRDSPTACSVITMTQDMAMSGLLFAGYGTGLKSRAVQAGLLAVGSVLVFDESHTMRQSAVTARSVVDMVQSAAERQDVMSGQVPVSRVVEMTATPADGFPSDVLAIEAADLADPQSVLSRVLGASKTICTSLDCPDRKAMVSGIVGVAAELYFSLGNGSEHTGPRTVGVVVNTVKDALDVAKKLSARDLSAQPAGEKKPKNRKNPTVVVLTGRMRPYDRAALQDRYPGLLTPDGNPEVDFLVSTQVLEIGVDIDLPAVVTQLAPVSALIQRFGRVNRRGVYPRAEIHVVGQSGAGGPYSAEDLERAALWVSSLDRGASPEVLRLPEYAPPGLRIARPVVERLDEATARGWSVTCGQPAFARDDRQLWITDDLSPDPVEVGLVLRHLPRGSALEDDLQCRSDLLAAMRVDPVESWTIRSSEIQSLLTYLGGGNSVAAFSEIRSDGSSSDLFVPRTKSDDWKFQPPPGSTIVVWCYGDVALLDNGVPVEGGTGLASPVPVSSLYVNPYERVTAEHCGCSEEHPHPRRDSDTVMAFGSDIPAVVDVDYQSAETSAWRTHEDAPLWEAAWRTWSRNLWVVVGRSVKSESDDPVWVVGTPWNREESSVWTPLHTPVRLEDHGSDVAVMSEDMARHAGLSDNFVSALRHAGQHHDSGKADRRFQCWMSGSPTPPTTVLAKSGKRVTLGGKHHGKPPEWRHEQLSAALAYRDSVVSLHSERDLITLLVGLSHGYGRSTFPHGFSSLIGDQTSHNAEDLFTHGDWDEMLYAAAVRLGPWILGWLEALLRAADHQVSAQGH